MKYSRDTIRALLKDNALVLYGQPKWTFGKNTCNTYEVFAEMLLTADRGSIHAAEVIDVIEADEELTQLFSNWFLHEALKTGEYLTQKTGIPIILSMNVLGFQANLPEFYDRIAAAIGQSSLTPDMIQFELSEAQQLTNTGIQNLNRVHDELGVKLLLGNFGMGHSNLDLLKYLHCDGIELAKAFAKDVPESDTACKLLVGISHLAQTLNLTVCAKGIETAEQMEFFENIDFFKGQGYLIGAPMPIDELAGFITKYAKR